MNSGFWKWSILSWEAVKSPSLKKFKQRMDDQLTRRPVGNCSRWPLQFLPTLGFCDALFYFWTLLTLSFCLIHCSIFIQMKWLSVTAVLCQSSLQSGSTISYASKHCIYNQYQSICWIWKNSCNMQHKLLSVSIRKLCMHIHSQIYVYNYNESYVRNYSYAFTCSENV